MVKMLDEDKKDFYQQSSKGNQLKWFRDGIWYKADSTGYEGLTEYMISHLLQYSTLNQDEFVIYNLEKVLTRNPLCFS